MKAFIIIIAVALLALGFLALYHFLKMSSMVSGTTTPNYEVIDEASSKSGLYIATAYKVTGGVTFDDMTEVTIRNATEVDDHSRNAVFIVNGSVPVSLAWDHSGILKVKADIRGESPAFVPKIARQETLWNGIGIKYTLIE